MQFGKTFVDGLEEVVTESDEPLVSIIIHIKQDIGMGLDQI